MTPFLIDNLKPVLRGKKILLGITGSIAAFKSCDTIRFLRACGAQVRVVLSQGAENFVTKTTLETLSGSPVLSGFWSSPEAEQAHGTHHIDTARWADLILVAPATAHLIAKIAHGMADDLLSTEILAFSGPLLVAPAMNPTMFSNPAVQANIKILKERGIHILGPTEGLTSCGEEGLGRMLEPPEIVKNTALVFSSPLLNKTMLITLGPTRSAIDPVRYITNRSSGLMGASLCWAAVQAGFEVTAVVGPTEVELPPSAEVIRVQTAGEMAEAAKHAWALKPDVFISAAAVLDWDILSPSPEKLKKNKLKKDKLNKEQLKKDDLGNEEDAPHLKLVENPDILATLSQTKESHQFVLGFAAETQNVVENAVEKLNKKKCNAIFANDVSHLTQGFESEFNSGWWITPLGKTFIEPGTKAELARHLILRILAQGRDQQ